MWLIAVVIPLLVTIVIILRSVLVIVLPAITLLLLITIAACLVATIWIAITLVISTVRLSIRIERRREPSLRWLERMRRRLEVTA